MREQVFTIEWSESQKCFHVDEAVRTFSRNMDAFATGTPTDYKILSIAHTREMASSMIDLLKNTPEYKNKFK